MYTKMWGPKAPGFNLVDSICQYCYRYWF